MLSGIADEDAMSELDYEGHVDLLTDDEDDQDMIAALPAPQVYLPPPAQEKVDEAAEPAKASNEALQDCPAQDAQPKQEEDQAQLLEMLRLAEIKLAAKRALLDLINCGCLVFEFLPWLQMLSSEVHGCFCLCGHALRMASERKRIRGEVRALQQTSPGLFKHTMTY